MSLKSYGVLKGTVVDYDGDRADAKSPHMNITIDGGGHSFSAAVNVMSTQAPSEIAFYVAEDYAHPQLALYPPLAAGFTKLASHAGTGALDYIRGNMFDFTAVTALPANAPGRDDDLLDRLELYLSNAKTLASEVDIYVFGEPFPDGIHDVHMNQGSIGSFAGTNSVWQDGAVLLHDRTTNRWTALFLAFQSQAIHTDDVKGNALAGSATFADIIDGKVPGGTATPPPTEPGPTPTPTPPATPTPPEPAPAQDGIVRIVAALVNPTGPEDRTGGETVTLLNTGTASVALTGWTLASTATSRMTLGTLQIAAGDALRVTAAAPLTLSNKGGIISLLDPSGTKVHGVSYTKAQAANEGVTIIF